MAKLSEMADINPRLVNRPEPNTLVSFVGMADLNADTGATSSGEERIFDEVAKGYTQFTNQDLLVAKITPCFENGKIAQADLSHSHGSGSTEFHVIRPDRSKLDDRFLLHFLRQPSVRIDGERRMTGSAGQRRVPERYLADLQVPVLPLPEQRRIAGILDHVDTLRVKSRKAISIFDDLAQSIFLDMFGTVASNDRQWPAGKVADLVAKFTSGKSFAAAESDGPDVRYRVLKVSSVTSGRFDASESKPVPSDYLPPLSHIVNDGDLIFSRANTEALIGATALAVSPPHNLLLPDKLWRFVWHADRPTHPLFVRQLFLQPEIRREISRRSSGTSGSMKNISQPKVLSIACGIPPLALQHQYGKRIESVEKIADQQRGYLVELDALFASLQHRAFRGNL